MVAVKRYTLDPVITKSNPTTLEIALSIILLNASKICRPDLEIAKQILVLKRDFMSKSDKAWLIALASRF